MREYTKKMKKLAIIHGELKNELQKRAVEELSSMLLEYTLEYPICIKCDTGRDLSQYRCIYIGTKESNPYVREHSAFTLTKSEEYIISVKDGVAVIEGFDDLGALYGALDFYNKYVVKNEYPDNDNYWVNFLLRDELVDFEYGSAPSIKERGLWTWGHVIYDYRDYLRNMMKLKMNRVVIWNDHVPVNADDIVKYAHSVGIKVIWGFSWLWDTNCARFDLANLDGFSEEIFQKYEREYAHLDGDGIYFQTFTELHTDNIGGINIAGAAAGFVNRTASLFFEKYPDMEIQFGLHATSVKDRLDLIAATDKRIRIVWEDCGAFPFSYIPNDVKDFDKTAELVDRIAHLRGKDDRFGVVTKGLVKLDWSKFEHPEGRQLIGISTRALKQNRIERKRRIWRYIQACWLANADKAQTMVRKMCQLKDGDALILALVEDGMFEEKIMYPVALYSEMLWNADADLKELTKEVAMRGYVDFA